MIAREKIDKETAEPMEKTHAPGAPVEHNSGNPQDKRLAFGKSTINRGCNLEKLVL